MRFLADESCDFMVVRALRAAGHEVEAIAERSPGMIDSDVLALAADEGRILLTEDKDFGQLVFARIREHSGVILVRYPARGRADLGRAAVAMVNELGDGLLHAFVVLQPGRIRRSPDSSAS
jgi:predicted nuclease of predicted toxin-antitoxin system